MSNVKYTLSCDGQTAYGKRPDGSVMIIDADLLPVISNINFYLCGKGCRQLYAMDHNRTALHAHLFPHRDGYEIDHINLNTLDNRRIHLRYCTHQQNQINQPLQINNTSGISGVSWYPPRKKFRARRKRSQHEIHLGYYGTFQEAVQARNVGMGCRFGEYGRYNDVPPAPEWIRKKVTEKWERFAELSVCEAFLNSVDAVNEARQIPCSELVKEVEGKDG